MPPWRCSCSRRSRTPRHSPQPRPGATTSDRPDLLPAERTARPTRPCRRRHRTLRRTRHGRGGIIVGVKFTSTLITHFLRLDRSAACLSPGPVRPLMGGVVSAGTGAAAIPFLSRPRRVAPPSLLAGHRTRALSLIAVAADEKCLRAPQTADENADGPDLAHGRPRAGAKKWTALTTSETVPSLERVLLAGWSFYSTPRSFPLTSRSRPILRRRSGANPLRATAHPELTGLPPHPPQRTGERRRRI